jgi:hypothetical protein
MHTKKPSWICTLISLFVCSSQKSTKVSPILERRTCSDPMKSSYKEMIAASQGTKNCFPESHLRRADTSSTVSGRTELKALNALLIYHSSTIQLKRDFELLKAKRRRFESLGKIEELGMEPSETEEIQRETAHFGELSTQNASLTRFHGREDMGTSETNSPIIKREFRFILTPDRRDSFNVIPGPMEVELIPGRADVVPIQTQLISEAQQKVLRRTRSSSLDFSSTLSMSPSAEQGSKSEA